VRSTDLLAHGFGGWLPFAPANKKQLLAGLPTDPGVYAIRCVKDFTRKIGTSDILYFGKGTNQRGLKNRVSQYFSPGPTQTTNLRLMARVGDCADYELAFTVTQTTWEAKALEGKLLALYESEHGELPPENKQR
jgi:excinuclease UvrABC nuclease subunit